MGYYVQFEVPEGVISQHIRHARGVNIRAIGENIPRKILRHKQIQSYMGCPQSYMCCGAACATVTPQSIVVFQTYLTLLHVALQSPAVPQAP
jgi:hypothetical protein